VKDSLNNNLKLDSIDLRDKCLQIANMAGDNAAHIGGALSCIDFIACIDNLYDISRNKETLRSIILSKGHACLALYALISKQGVINIEEIANTFENDSSKFLGHPSRNLNIGIQFSTGSLGNGLAHAAGKALFIKEKSNLENIPSPTICIVGDGECNEGIIWETFQFISGKKLNNLIIFIDCNGWQQTQQSLYYYDNYHNLFNRLKTYELNTYMLNGHCHDEILNILKKKDINSKVILGLTTKGKGYSIFEDNNNWHHGILTDKQYQEIKESGT
tara:strand:+ start:1387 stop:2208 length:822 start_codon:yes stop_codon:yes gene_type:complete